MVSTLSPPYIYIHVHVVKAFGVQNNDEFIFVGFIDLLISNIILIMMYICISKYKYINTYITYIVLKKICVKFSKVTGNVENNDHYAPYDVYIACYLPIFKYYPYLFLKL